MNQAINNPKWWRYTAIFLLIVTIVVVAFSFFCLRATKHTDELGPLLMAMYFFATLYTSYGLLLLSLIGVIIGFLLKYSLKLYMIMAIVSLLPTVFFVIFG